MASNRTGFAPYWLTRAVLEDPEGARFADEFVNNIPREFISRLFVINCQTGDEYEAADRYMIALTYLASVWALPVRFKIVCGYKGEVRKELDTSALDARRPVPLFLQATRLGDDAWQKELERTRARSLFTQLEPERSGAYQWVWDDEIVIPREW